MGIVHGIQTDQRWQLGLRIFLSIFVKRPAGTAVLTTFLSLRLPNFSMLGTATRLGSQRLLSVRENDVLRGEGGMKSAKCLNILCLLPWVAAILISGPGF